MISIVSKLETCTFVGGQPKASWLLGQDSQKFYTVEGNSMTPSERQGPGDNHSCRGGTSVRNERSCHSSLLVLSF